jgi:hypothetical protein
MSAASRPSAAATPPSGWSWLVVGFADAGYTICAPERVAGFANSALHDASMAVLAKTSL